MIEPLRKGQQFAGIPVDAINAGIAARNQQLGRPVYTVPPLFSGGSGGAGGGAAPQCGQTIEIDNRGGLAVRLVSADCTTPWSVIPAQSCVGSLVSVPT